MICYTAVLYCFAIFGSSSASTCGVPDFLGQLTQLVQTIQQNMKDCGPVSKPTVSRPKAGPAGPPGPAGEIDMAAVEQLIQLRIEKSVDNLRASGGLCLMGMKSGLIPDSAITARTFYSSKHEPFQARLDNRVSPTSTGSWSAKSNAVGEWLQVDFGNEKQVAGVITQGRPSHGNQWVTSFKVSCGTNQNNLAFVTENRAEKVFNGNADSDTKIYNRFPTLLTCRFIRIYPQSYKNHMSMRVEFVPGACVKPMRL